MTEKEVAIVLIKDKMFRVTPKSKRATLLHIDPKKLVRYINCPSVDMLRGWLREQYKDHPKGYPWYINPEMALDAIKHYGLA